MIRIDDDLSIPEQELSFTASRGGGPGGQHVNKVATRMTLHFDVQGSPSLTDAQRSRILRVMSSRITNDGVLQLSSHEHRSQAANRAVLLERFATLLARALRKPKRRRKTRPTRGSRERRLQAKKQRGQVKRQRGRVRRHEE